MSATTPSQAASISSTRPVEYAGGGHLRIYRAANLGNAIGVFVSIDGVRVARLGYGQSYSAPISAGPHVVSVIAYPNYLFLAPTEIHLTVQRGQNYAFTLNWRGDRLVLR